MLHPADELTEILREYGFSQRCSLTPLAGGLINHTLRVDEGGRRTVLQRLHPIFRPEVHLDIEPITAHLERKGVRTPRLIPTTAGHLWTTDASGQVWRMLSWLDGRTLTQIERLETAHAAGALVGRFHQAVRDLRHTFHFTRPGAHDTPAHLAALRRAISDCASHPDFAAVMAIADPLLQHAERLEPLPPLPPRIIHGDLKIANIMFDDAGERALALLDLDTMAELTIPIELGDAMRSWCNPDGEDATHARFRPDVFEAAMTGYAAHARGLLTSEEVGAVVLGIETIALELAARFCTDALREVYFGWDASRFTSRSAHNRVRAQSQLAVAESVRAQRTQLEDLLERLLRSPASA